VTTTVATTTLVSLCMRSQPAADHAAERDRPARRGDLYSAGGNPAMTLADEKLTSAGATGTRTFNQAGTPSTNDRAYCGLIALKNS
jgi:hypothetical protein